MVERWSVKTGTDPDAGLINLGSTSPTTVAKLQRCPHRVRSYGTVNVAELLTLCAAAEHVTVLVPVPGVVLDVVL